jgi:hypothetical protein
MIPASMLDGILDPLANCLDTESAHRVLNLRFATEVQDRIDVLAERANEGVLTDDERSEYEAIVNAADIVAILKRKVRRQFASVPS